MNTQERKKRMLSQISSTAGKSEIGRFKNVHGELFIIYQSTRKDSYYITGDEFGWEGSWQLKRVLLPDSFVFLCYAVKMYGIDDTFTFSIPELKELFSILPKSNEQTK